MPKWSRHAGTASQVAAALGARTAAVQRPPPAVCYPGPLADLTTLTAAAAGVWRSPGIAAVLQPREPSWPEQPSTVGEERTRHRRQSVECGRENAGSGRRSAWSGVDEQGVRRERPRQRTPAARGAAGTATGNAKLPVRQARHSRVLPRSAATLLTDAGRMRGGSPPWRRPAGRAVRRVPPFNWTLERRRDTPHKHGP